MEKAAKKEQVLNPESRGVHNVASIVIADYVTSRSQSSPCRAMAPRAGLPYRVIKNSPHQDRGAGANLGRSRLMVGTTAVI